MWGCGVIAEVVAWRKSRRMEERCVLCCVVLCCVEGVLFNFEASQRVYVFVCVFFFFYTVFRLCIYV